MDCSNYRSEQYIVKCFWPDLIVESAFLAARVACKTQFDAEVVGWLRWGGGLAGSCHLTTEFSRSRAARTSYTCGEAVSDPMTACAAP